METSFFAEDPQRRRRHTKNYYHYPVTPYPAIVFRVPRSNEDFYFGGVSGASRVLHVCRLARLVALQSWMQAVRRGDALTWNEVPGKRESVLRALGSLVEDLKKRVEDNGVSGASL